LEEKKHCPKQPVGDGHLLSLNERTGGKNFEPARLSDKIRMLYVTFPISFALPNQMKRLKSFKIF